MRNTKAKTKRESADDDLPAELDSKKLKFVGFGIEALRAHAAKRRTSIELDPDVAKVFPDSTAVNEFLRAVIHTMPSAGKKRRKSA